jgi:hypothetical protein
MIKVGPLGGISCGYLFRYIVKKINVILFNYVLGLQFPSTTDHSEPTGAITVSEKSGLVRHLNWLMLRRAFGVSSYLYTIKRPKCGNCHNQA